MDWLFEGLLSSQKNINYSIRSVKENNNNYTLKISQKKSGVPAPVLIAGLKDDKIVHQQWYPGFTGKEQLNFPKGDYDALALDPMDQGLDILKKRDYWSLKKWPRHFKKMHIGLPAIFDKPNSLDIFVFPLIGYNAVDKFELGLRISSPLAPVQNFHYAFTPFYAFGTKKIRGMGDIHYHLIPASDKIYGWDVGVFYRHFGYRQLPTLDRDLDYHSFQPYFKMHLANNRYSGTNSRIELRAFINADEILQFPRDSGGSITQSYQNYQIYRASYSYENPHILSPTRIKTQVQYHPYRSFQDESRLYLRLGAEIQKEWRYAKKRYFRARLYAGGFLINSDRDQSGSATRSFAYQNEGSLALSYNGYHDYSSGHTFGGRTTPRHHLMSQQIYIEQGGMKLNFGESQRSNLGNSNNYIAALNLSSDLPLPGIFGKLIRPYLDIGTFDEEPTIGKNHSNWLISGGVNLSLFGIADIYFPVYHSRNIRDLYASDNVPYWQQICFGITQQDLSISRIILKAQELMQ